MHPRHEARNDDRHARDQDTDRPGRGTRGGSIQAVTRARSVGFRNINLDLMYGLPGQDLQSWKRTVERILILKPEHVSAYALTMEHGTPLGQWSRRGLLASVDDDLAADMYEWVQDRMQSAGYTHYEISNWAMPGYECRHNLNTWNSAGHGSL